MDKFKLVGSHGFAAASWRMTSSLTTGSVVARCGDIVAVAEILSRRIKMPGAAMPAQKQQSYPAIDPDTNCLIENHCYWLGNKSCMMRLLVGWHDSSHREPYARGMSTRGLSQSRREAHCAVSLRRLPSGCNACVVSRSRLGHVLSQKVRGLTLRRSNLPKRLQKG